MAWKLSEHQTEPHYLGELLYWQQLLEPDGSADVVVQNDCSLMSCLRYRSADLESASETEKMVRGQQFHEVLMSLAPGWGLHAEVRRRQADPYPTRRWPHPVAALIDVECEEQAREAHYETDYTLTLTHHLRGVSQAWQDLLWENIPEELSGQSPSRQFRDEVSRIAGDLGTLWPEVAVLRGDDLVTYLKSTISLVHQEVGVPDPPWFLGRSLSDMTFDPGAIPKLGESYLRVMTVRNKRRTRQVGYPPETYPGILDVLHALSLEYRLVFRWLPLSMEAADKELNSYENHYLQRGKSVVSGLLERVTGGTSRKRNQAADDSAAEVAEGRRLLQEGVVQFGYFTTTVIVWDEEYGLLGEKAKVVEQTMRQAKFIAMPETFNATEALLGAVPGDFFHNVRKPLVNSLNAAHCMGTDCVSAGAKYVPHLQGGPWFIGTARGKTPYGVTTHHGDVGDYFVIGPKGSGKSALQAFMALQWLQYGHAQVRALDKGGSLLCATYAVDGVWMDLTPGRCQPLQPLAYIDQEDERAWAAEWVGDLLTLEHVLVNHEVRREVWAALGSLASFPPPRRTLSGLSGLVQRQDLRDALHLYTVDGTYGSLFDGSADPLPSADWQCFELEGLLTLPRIVPLVIAIIFRSCTRQLDGRPTLIPMDECWAYFDIPAFEQRIRDYIKTVRRKNGTMGFLTQELFDLHQSRIAEAVMSACMTRFYCPNANVLDPEPAKIYAGYGLTERQRELIARGVPKRDYYMTSQGHGHRLFQVGMGPITQAFCGRSRIEDLAAIHEVKATAQEPFGVAWLRHEGLHEAANLLAVGFEEKARYGRPHPAAAMVGADTPAPYVLS
jgi:type IV secretion system protein VirB4